jgi:hypothetical protein
MRRAAIIIAKALGSSPAIWRPSPGIIREAAISDPNSIMIPTAIMGIRSNMALNKASG